MIVTRNGPQTIDEVKTYFELGNLFLSPVEYQRENVWNPPQKRLLIDTIFRRMDIPKLYFWKIDDLTLASGYPDGEAKDLYKQILDRKRRENDEPSPFIFEAVDGQQRIRTILEFMGIQPPNRDCYRGEWHPPYPSNPDTPIAKGKMYAQLNAEQRILFGTHQLTVMVLENAKIDKVRDMFLRLQNGTPLNVQQKRDATGSMVGRCARDLASLSFFSTSAPFDNGSGEHHRVISQMLLLESKGKIFSCTSKQLDKFYETYKNVKLDSNTTARSNKIIKILGNIFPKKNPALNRSYVLGLYWMISRIQTYEIEPSEYPKILANFEQLDQHRLVAMNRDYFDKSDDVYKDLSESMSRGTDGLEQINDRYKILTQFLFEGVHLEPHQKLDPKRLFTDEERLILYRRAQGKCQLGCGGQVCGRDLDFDDCVVDHIKPHSRGGFTSLDNGRIAYGSCNITRGTREDFDPKTECYFVVRADS